MKSLWISFTNNERREVGQRMNYKYYQYWNSDGQLYAETLEMALKDSQEDMFEMQKLMIRYIEEFRNSLWYY